MPPSSPETLRTDPRCLTKKAELEVLAEGLKAANIPMVHWDEADGPTECLFVQNQDFKAYLWEAFMPTAAYADWLLETDMTSAYAYERSVLQMLSVPCARRVVARRCPRMRCTSKRCCATYPDVRHRLGTSGPVQGDRVLPAVELLVARGSRSRGHVDVIVPNVLRQLQAHITRPLQARRRIGDDRFFDLHYGALMRDPIGMMRSLYEWAGDDLTPSTEQAMLDWLERNPQDRFRCSALLPGRIRRDPSRSRTDLRRIPVNVRCARLERCVKAE